MGLSLLLLIPDGSWDTPTVADLWSGEPDPLQIFQAKFYLWMNLMLESNREKSINSCTQKTRSKARVGWAGVKERKGTLKIGYSDFSTAGRLKQLDFFLVGLSLCSRKAGTAWRLYIATRSLEQWLQSRGKLLQVVHIRLHNVCCWLIESPLMATPEVFPSFTGAGCFPFAFRASLITGRFSGSWRKDLLEAQNWHKASLKGKLCWTEGLNS